MNSVLIIPVADSLDSTLMVTHTTGARRTFSKTTVGLLMKHRLQSIQESPEQDAHGWLHMIA